MSDTLPQNSDELQRALDRVADAVIDLSDSLRTGIDCSEAWATFDRNVAILAGHRDPKATP